jgi:hypothetical protein
MPINWEELEILHPEFETLTPAEVEALSPEPWETADHHLAVLSVQACGSNVALALQDPEETKEEF